MSNQEDGAPTPAATCENAACGRDHYGLVAWCPFCGTKQSRARVDAAAPVVAAAPPVAAANAPASVSAPAPAVEAPAAAPVPPDPVAPPRFAGKAPAPSPVVAPPPARPEVVAPRAEPPVAGTPSFPPPRPKWGRRVVSAVVGITALWWGWGALVGTSPNQCEGLLEAAGSLEQAGDARAAQAKVNLALNACKGPMLDRARVLNRTLQPVITALEACERVKREAEEQLNTGQLRQASKMVIATPTSCASRPEMVALRQSIDTARKGAADAVVQARAQVSEGAVDDARASLEKANRLDRDNPDVARVAKTVEAQAREVAIRDALAPSQPAASPSTPATQTAPPPTVAAAPAPAPAPASADTTTAVTQMMSLAMNGNWSRLDSQVQALKTFSSPQQGDRKSSRAANTEGLRLLRAGNAPAALLVLRTGAQADPSDVEVINNLGFAQMQAGQLQEASSTLERTILMAPDRTSAWANYSETLALGGNEPGSLAALIIAVHFSSDRQKSIEALSKVRETHPNAIYFRVLGRVLADMNAIPRGPNDRIREPSVTMAAPPVAAPPTDAKRIECEVLVRGGQRALATRSYDVALQQAADALAAYAGCPGAQELATSARQTKDAARAGVILR